MPGEQELRRASESFQARLSELHALELRKLDLKAGSAEQIRVAREAEALAEELLRVARREADLTEQVAASQPTSRPTSIGPSRELHVILGEWRDAERVLDNETPGTDGWQAARADVERLRDEYRRAFEGGGESDRG